MKLSPEDDAELRRLLLLRRALGIKQLMARFKVSRSYIWHVQQSMAEGPRETKQNVHKGPLTELELDVLAAELLRETA